MDDGLAALRGLVFSENDLAGVCTEVLTVLAYGERAVETIEFNDVDVTADRTQHVVVVRGVLSVNDEVVEFPEERFVELATAVAEPLSGDELAEWRQRRERRVWRMSPAPE